MKDENIKKVLLLGSGALKIGEAGEFDYFRFAAAEGIARGRYRDCAHQPEYRNRTDIGRCCRPDLLPASAAILRRACYPEGESRRYPPQLRWSDSPQLWCGTLSLRASWRNMMSRYWVLQYRLSWILRTVSSS